MNKKLYEQPSAEVLEVRFEGALLALSTQGNSISNATIEQWDEEL